jgi:hypothetical protein
MARRRDLHRPGIISRDGRGAVTHPAQILWMDFRADFLASGNAPALWFFRLWSFR